MRAFTTVVTCACLLSLAGSSVLHKRDVDLIDGLDELARNLEDVRTTCMCMHAPEVNEKLARIGAVVDDLAYRCVNGTDKKRCPTGWHLFGESCYYYGEDLLTWESAFWKCDELSSYLAEVESDAENEFLVWDLWLNLTSQTFPRDYAPWLGATDRDYEGVWKWATSGDLLTYSAWAYNEPNGGYTENCLNMHHIVGATWNDSPCNVEHPYICEKTAL